MSRQGFHKALLWFPQIEERRASKAVSRQGCRNEQRAEQGFTCRVLLRKITALDFLTQKKGARAEQRGGKGFVKHCGVSSGRRKVREQGSEQARVHVKLCYGFCQAEYW